MKLTRFVDSYIKAFSTAVRVGNRFSVSALVEIAYARLFFNIGPFYYSLFSLYHKPISEWTNYILDSEANLITRRAASPAARRLITDKLAFWHWLKANALNTVPVLSYLSRLPGNCPPGIERISTAEAFVQVSHNYPNFIFIKVVDGAHGLGAFTANRRGNGWSFDGHTLDARELFEYCMHKMDYGTGWIVLPQIHPHREIAEALSPNALCTIRIVTKITRNGVQCLFALLKIPVGDNLTDNFSEGSTGNLVAPIDLATGRLEKATGSLNPIWPNMTSITSHPETGSCIPGFQLPFWTDTIETVRRAQTRLEDAPSIGWDVAITDDGPIVIEANVNYSVEIHQVAMQRGLRKEFFGVNRS